jgi:SH3-like domain-containing protein
MIPDEPFRFRGIAMHVSSRGGVGCARLWLVTVAALFALVGLDKVGALATDAAPPPGTSASGLPVPRFVSLKSDRVNLRTGPGTDYPTAWVFRRAGLPVEVMNEFESWRQVRDSEGTTGWVLQSLLSGRRTALVSPWDIKAGNPPPKVTVRSDDSENARAVAIVEVGVIANIAKCDGRWCQVSIENFRGYLQQKQLWGIYPNEILK